MPLNAVCDITDGVLEIDDLCPVSPRRHQGLPRGKTGPLPGTGQSEDCPATPRPPLATFHNIWLCIVLIFA